jgi:hypothetical protein
VVPEVDCFADGYCLSVFHKHFLVAPIVFNGGANVVSLPAAVVP